MKIIIGKPYLTRNIDAVSDKISAIRNTIERRGITRLCHMTQLEKAICILKNNAGIVATSFMEKPELYINDTNRIDGKYDYISTSIQNPNFWYYNVKRNVIPQMHDWVVFYIDPKTCEKKETLFCAVNAATNYGNCISEEGTHFENCFSETVGKQTRTTNMPSNCPTDDQAEVMIYKHIPTGDITGIGFESVDALLRFKTMAMKEGIEYPNLYVAPNLFSRINSDAIRQGVSFPEKIYEKETEKWQKDLSL